LLPGHYLIWKNGQFSTHRWWHLGEKSAAMNPFSESELVSHWKNLFDSAVSYRRISDVPVGVFLSGGLDSSSVAASLAMQVGNDVTSFNMRFDKPDFDESQLAEQVAQRWNIQNHILEVSDKQLYPLLEQAARFNDEPLAHGNELYIYEIARYAKPLVTVLLSGEGADETLAGYVRYQPLRYASTFKYLRYFSPLLRLPGLSQRLKKLDMFLGLSSLDQWILYNACNTLPSQLSVLGFQPKEHYSYRQTILEEAKRYFTNPIQQVMYVDLHTFLTSELDRIDRMTMAASVECRVPFLDYRLVEFAMKVPTRQLFNQGQGKWLVRRAMQTSLPPEVIKHKKWGFGVPWKDIMRTNPEIRHLLTGMHQMEPILSGPFDRSVLHAFVSNFLNGADENFPLVFQFLMIVLCHKQVFGHPDR